MTDLPRPDLLEEFLGDIEHTVSMVREAYRWAYPNAYSRPKRGQTERTSGGGSGDPTGDVVASTERYRVKLRHAVREVQDARNRLMGAQIDLNDALMMLEPEQSVDPVERSLEHPANKGDLARARKAQAKRAERAKKTPWGSEEVTG
jgi:hypothetical protein